MSIDCNISSDNPVRVIDIFVEQLDLGNLSLAEAMPVALAMGWHFQKSEAKIFVLKTLQFLPVPLKNGNV